MEEAAKSIKNLADQILPKQPYYLSLSPDSKYDIPDDENCLDEQSIRQLQYLTLAGGEADRGVLLTRAYFTVRQEPNSSNAPMSTTLKLDPNKPRKKVSLKDWKNKKVEGDSPTKIEAKEKPNGLSTIKEKEEFKKPTEPTLKEMDSHRDVKRSIASIRVEATRQHSPSPERRKRVAEVDQGPKPVKRVKVEDVTPNGAAPRPLKSAASQKFARSIPPGKKETRDPKPSLTSNGKSAPSNSALRAASPKHASQVNGHGKNNGGQATHKRAVSNSEPVSKAIPKLLSPLHISDLSVDKTLDTFKDSVSESRPSPRKRLAETGSSKAQLRKLRDDHEPSPIAKKRHVLPSLLSPTLPAIVMSELAKIELAKIEQRAGTSLKDGGPKSSQASDSSVIVKKPVKSTREETIHVDNKKEEPAQFIVTMKYSKKRDGKTIERLLNLPSGGKKRMEGLKREDATPREASVSIEPGTARKRPRTTAETGEALKRPKMSEALRPSTPPKQSTAMSRIASNSSQVGTPGAANSLTPSAQLPAERRREPIAPEKLQRAQRLHAHHGYFMGLGTKLKHERDAIMKNKAEPSEREHQTAIAAGIQSLLLYMHALKLQSDALDLERLPRRPQSWKEVIPFIRVVMSDCSRHQQLSAQLSALLFRIQAICTNYVGRSLWFLPSEADAAEKLLFTVKEEANLWRSADHWRRRLGAYDGGPDLSDGGTVGKLLDRIGPWTTPEEVVPITLEIMRNIIRIDGPWKPIDELAKLGRFTANGTAG